MHGRSAPPMILLAARDSPSRASAVRARDDGRRRPDGVLRTAHGEIPTAAFMPVGPGASAKSLDPDEVRALGAHVILGNTYHLHFRPGEDVIQELGGSIPSAAGTGRS